MHPLTELPTLRVKEVVYDIVTRPDKQGTHPAREKLLTYVNKRDGATMATLNPARMFFGRLSKGELPSAKPASPPSFGEISALNVNFCELFGDEQCAFSLCDFRAWNPDVKLSNVTKTLNARLNDLLAVNVSKNQGDRVNPVIIRELYGTEFTDVLTTLGFTRDMYLSEYAHLLPPDYVDALGIDMNQYIVSDKDFSLVGPNEARTMLSLGTATTWKSVGIGKRHLAYKGWRLGSTLAAIAKTVGWDVSETQRVFI